MQDSSAMGIGGDCRLSQKRSRYVWRPVANLSELVLSAVLERSVLRAPQELGNNASKFSRVPSVRVCMFLCLDGGFLVRTAMPDRSLPARVSTLRPAQSGRDVANCHKLPGYAFDRRIIPVEEVSQRLQESISAVLAVNPKARVILTVSPVRHWRDGPVDNARSKAHLVAGAHGAIELLRSAGIAQDGVGSPGHVSYFPAFELINDDLRSDTGCETTVLCRAGPLGSRRAEGTNEGMAHHTAGSLRCKRLFCRRPATFRT